MTCPMEYVKESLINILKIVLPVRRTCCEPHSIGHQMTPLSPAHIASAQPEYKLWKTIQKVLKQQTSTTYKFIK